MRIQTPEWRRLGKLGRDNARKARAATPRKTGGKTTPWRWTAYCLFTFAFTVLAFRFVVDPPYVLVVRVAVVVLGVLALVFAPDFENNGGPLSSRGSDVLVALGWAGGVIGLAFFPPQPSWAWVVATIGLLTAMQRYVGRQWYG